MIDVENNPHPVDEDPEDHIGEEVPDPWADGRNWSSLDDQNLSEKDES